jgi:hypothetical protein
MSVASDKSLNLVTRSFPIVAFAAVLAGLPACATTKTGRPDPTSDRVTVTGVSPDPDRALRPGQTVRFRVKLTVTLARAEFGHVSLVIQDNRGENLKKDGPQSRMAVGRGTELIELFDEVTIGPNARWVHLFVPLFHDSGDTSVAVDTVRFAVVGFK